MESEKSPISTLLMILIISIVIFALVIVVYKMIIEEPETIKSEQVLVENTTKKEGRKKSEITNKTDATENRIDTYDSRVIELVNIFNTCSFAKNFREMADVVDGSVEDIATFTGMKLLVYSEYGYSSEIIFTLNNNILSTVIPYREDNTDKFLIEAATSQMLLDCAGMRKGYSEFEVGKAISKDESKYYTVENDGIEYCFIPDTYNISIKIDLESDFPFMNVYQ